MKSNSYNLIVSSAKIEKVQVAEAQNKMATLFKLKETQLEKIFSGKFVRFIKNVDYDSAQRYQHAIKNIGLVCQIEDMSDKEQETKLVSTPAETNYSLSPKKQETVKNHYCPMCKVLQENQNECEHCFFNLEAYRETMKQNNFIEAKGIGYIAERRKTHRRNNTVARREVIRMGEGSDRRTNEDRRKDTGAWGYA